MAERTVQCGVYRVETRSAQKMTLKNSSRNIGIILDDSSDDYLAVHETSLLAA